MTHVVTQEHIEFYQKNGFVQVDNILSQEEVAELTEAMEEVMVDRSQLSIATDVSTGSYYKVLNLATASVLWRLLTSVRSACFHKQVYEVSRVPYRSPQVRTLSSSPSICFIYSRTPSAVRTLVCLATSSNVR
ncbi:MULTISPECIES: hypothetical protein [Bacillales]|uniref:hypothetical protein n=1 Tax=Bacillales TaxID=1385 RepID=UPI0006A76335|nr:MULTISPECIES: hypothetical protein [Bacillales]